MPNEFGDYLPGDDEVLEEESERIQAESRPSAEKKCAQIAGEYGGFDSEVERIGKKWFDCK